MEEALGYGASVLTTLGLLRVAVWFCCTIAESLVKMRRRLNSSRYNALLKENQRLRSFLADVKKENADLREIYYSERTRRRGSVRQNVA
jgi:hypothetical protein